MDFRDFVEQMDEGTFVRLEGAEEMLDSYRRHVADGLHEALDYVAHDVLEDIILKRRKDLFLTFDHLLRDDPEASDGTEAAYGDMLAEANLEAGRLLLRSLKENESLRKILRSTVDKTVGKYAHMSFPEPDGEEEDDEAWIDLEEIEVETDSEEDGD